jgi:hypothetical protein
MMRDEIGDPADPFSRHREAALAAVAIQIGIHALDLDCFAALAMTAPKSSKDWFQTPHIF